MGRRKKAPDLGALADDANRALNSLYNEGYVEEVDAIRGFLIAQGEDFQSTLRVQHQIALDLARRMKAAGVTGPGDEEAEA